MKKKIISTTLSTAIASTLLANGVYADSIDKKSLDTTNIISSKIEAKKLLSNLPGNYAIEKNYNQFTIKSVERDTKGFKHYTLVPKVNGVEAINRDVKIHVDKNGKVVLVNGELNKGEVKATNQIKVTSEEAVDIAFKSIAVDRTLAKDSNGDNPVLFSKLIVDADKQVNAYHIRLSLGEPTVGYWEIIIDSETGEVISRQDLIQGATIRSRGIGLDNTYKPIDIEQQNDGNYGLRTTRNNTIIETMDGLNTDRVSRELVTDKDKIFKDNRDKAAVDAHYYISKVYDYYLKTHNRESYDGYGKKILSVVHHKTNHNNAFWNGTGMYYGDGDGNEFSGLSGAYDIIAHEFTHAITSQEVGLVYQNQPGAISEHLSDAFAYFMEPNWLIGEKVFTPNEPGDALRNMQDPSLSIPSQPVHMREYLYLPNTAEGDRGGVHYNSGILNKAFYNLIDVEKMDVKNAEQVYYRAIDNYLTGTSKFLDLKIALTRAATDLYGSTEASKVTRAFDAVDIK